MARFALFAFCKLVAILIIVFLLSVVLALDLVALQQAELIAGVVVWLVILGLIFKVEHDLELRVQILAIRKD